MERLGNLHRLPDLVANRASYEELNRCVWTFKFPLDVTESEWLQATKIVGDACIADLSWIGEEMRDYFQRQCTDLVRDAFVESWPGGFISESKLKDSLLPFVRWLETQTDRIVLRFAWDLLRATWKGDERADYFPVLWMKWSGRLKGEISFDNLELAVSLAEESGAMYWWPKARWSVVRWPRERETYIELMNHESYLVRAAAASCLGQLYRGCIKNPCQEPAPYTAFPLEFIKRQEQKNAGVAGPFLMGAQWGIDWPGDKEWDYRAWFLDVLRSSDRERDVPHLQSLEFYAHELFAGDEEAILEFLRIGRRDLALMTATEDSEDIEEMRPFLEKLAASNDPIVARAIQMFLVEGRHPDGLTFAD